MLLVLLVLLGGLGFLPQCGRRCRLVSQPRTQAGGDGDGDDEDEDDDDEEEEEDEEDEDEDEEASEEVSEEP